MNGVAVIEPRSADRPASWRSGATLVTAMIFGVGFVAVFAVRYFLLDQRIFGLYWPRRGWLLLHIAGGMVALLTGPGQLNSRRRAGFAGRCRC